MTLNDSSTEAVPAVTNDERYTYLGMGVGPAGPASCSGALDKLVESAAAIAGSKLKPAQKWTALKFHLFPSVTHALRVSKAEWSKLGKGGAQVGVNGKLRKSIKEILNLPSEANTGFLYSPAKDGGAGLCDLRLDLAALRINDAVKLLNHSDPTLRQMAREDLRHASSKRFPELPAAVAVRHFLNGLKIAATHQSCCTASWWSEVRKARDVLQGHLGSPVALNFNDASDLYSVSVEDRTLPRRPLRELRYKTACKYLAQWRGLASQGRFAQALGMSAHSQINGDNHLSFCDSRFIHTARLCLTPTNAINHMGRDPRCRRCGAQFETLSHVLNCCTHHAARWRKRHDGVLTLLQGAIREQPGNEALEVVVDKLYAGALGPDGRALRPDLIVLNHQKKTAEVIDVKCSIDLLPSIDAARASTTTKYASIATHLGTLGFSTHISTLTVCSLGSFPALNYLPLNRLGLSTTRIKDTARKMIRHSIHWSRNIWVTHVTGLLQIA